MTGFGRPISDAIERIDPAAPPARNPWAIDTMFRDSRLSIEPPAAAANDDGSSALFPALQAAAMFARCDDDLDDADRPTAPPEATD